MPRVVFLFWRVVLAAHAAAAAAWFWLMPGGFPIGHVRFWANRVVPVGCFVVALAGLFAAWRGRMAILRLIIVAFPAAWLAMGATMAIVFPVSGRALGLKLILFALALGAAAVLTCRKHRPRLLPMGAIALAAALVGIALPLTQRAGPPSTLPVNLPLPELDATDADLPRDPIQLGVATEVHAASGAVRLRCGSLRLDVYPLLTFQSRSPDRCWTILAPLALRVGSRWRVAAGRIDKMVQLTYRGDETGYLAVSPRGEAGGLSIEAFARLDQPVYSHLNTFCEIGIAGHKRLALSFSPCPDARIDVLPSDYPVGRPRRLAYVDADGRFRVVEATSGEKGPFHELAAGPLRRGEPLAITLYDDESGVCCVVLDDWAAQAGTALSPTAGWGLPVNAIEFSREGDAPGSEAALFITLAGTSVGRGWDTVGHAPGTYRNRMRIEPVGAGEGG